MTVDSEETAALLERLAAGDRRAMNQLLARHREGLRRMVELRLAPALRQRVDASDVLQEAELDAFTRIDTYLRSRPIPFYLWLRKTTLQRLSRVCERHIRAAKRSVERELSMSENASKQLSRGLVDKTLTPSQHVMRQDLINHVTAALSQLSETDREILLMRHIEKLTNVEIADVLEMSRDAVAKRHMRCLMRLRENLRRSGIEVS